MLGGAAYSVVKVWVRLSGPDGPQQRRNQRHILARRPVRAMSVRPGVDYLLDKAEARARVSIAHGFGAIDMDGQDTRGVLGLTGMD